MLLHFHPLEWIFRSVECFIKHSLRVNTIHYEHNDIEWEFTTKWALGLAFTRYTRPAWIGFTNQI